MLDLLFHQRSTRPSILTQSLLLALHAVVVICCQGGVDGSMRPRGDSIILLCNFPPVGNTSNTFERMSPLLSSSSLCKAPQHKRLVKRYSQTHPLDRNQSMLYVYNSSSQLAFLTKFCVTIVLYEPAKDFDRLDPVA